MRTEHGILVQTIEDRFFSLDEEIEKFLEHIHAVNGTVTVFSPHTTLCIKILENEVLSLKDISLHLERMAPRGVEYLHDDLMLRQVPREERINGFAHVQSLYFNHSETIPVVAGNLLLGKWQTVFAVELDPYRERTILFHYTGD